MPSKTKTIRDFLYIDVDRLYSLCSQINEGIAKQVLKSWTTEGASRDVQGGKKGSEKQTEETNTETAQEATTYILHDHLYNDLEDSLSSVIVKPSGVTAENWHDVLGKAFLIKVEGMAEINDFEHLIYSTSNFVDIAGELAYLPKNQQIKQEIERHKNALIELEQKAKNSSGASKQQINAQIIDIKNELKQLSDVEQVKRKLLDLQGMTVDEDDMVRIAKLLKHYGTNNFDITIVPEQGADGIVFRGILDKKLLRVEPEYLRRIYEGAVAKKWTMVGEITHMPVPLGVAESSSEPLQEDSQSTGMKDALRALISKMSDLESMFHQTTSRLELRVRPLAIYQETSVKIQVKQPED